MEHFYAAGYLPKSGKRGLQSRCKECMKSVASPKAIKWARDNPKEHAARTMKDYKKNRSARMSVMLKYNYGITTEQKRAMYEQQGQRCANSACATTLVFRKKDASNASYACVDHDHATDEVRGLLCPRCNWLEGMMGDYVELVEGLFDYRINFPGCPDTHQLENLTT